MRGSSLLADKIVTGKRVDIKFLVAAVLLMGLGAVTLYSLNGASAVRMLKGDMAFWSYQLIVMLVSVVALIVMSIINLDYVRKCLPLIVAVTLILCVLTIIPGIGIEKKGARRWFGIRKVFEFQPSEMVKLVIVLFLSKLFAKKYNRLDELSVSVIPAIIMTSFFILLIYLQRDFSTAIIIMLVALVLFFFSGIKKRWFLILFCFILPTVVLVVFTEPYRVRRIISFLNPALDPYGANYQLNAAKRAIASGGFWGKGFGGIIKGPAIPEVLSDFIFAGWAVEMGFFGVLLYFVILIWFSIRGYIIAFRCTDRFRSFVALGAVTAILFQSVMNCGVVCGFLPSTGIPLPFFSSGGSSLLVSMSLRGLIINVSRMNTSQGSLYE